uniref:Uncharacterized protein n=1 Tax=Anguilla anguilla TaxID=7936 RepID=A0A0E9PLH5_ANGAN
MQLLLLQLFTHNLEICCITTVTMNCIKLQLLSVI